MLYHDDNEDRQRKDVCVVMDIEHQGSRVRRTNLGHALQMVWPENARTVDIWAKHDALDNAHRLMEYSAMGQAK